MKDQETELITLDIPQREGKEGYIGTLFSLFLRVGGIIASTEFKETDLRIEYMTQFLISLIPGEKSRNEIRDKLTQDIYTKLNENPSLDTDSKARLRNMICIEYIGKVVDFADKHMGVSIENRVGFCR